MAEKSPTRCDAADCRRRKWGEHFCKFHTMNPGAVNESQRKTRARNRDSTAKRVERRRNEQFRNELATAEQAVRVALEALGLPEDAVDAQITLALGKVARDRIDTARRSLTRADADIDGSA